MTDKMAIRTFPTTFKLKAIKRAEGGEGVLPVARKLGKTCRAVRGSRLASGGRMNASYSIPPPDPHRSVSSGTKYPSSLWPSRPLFGPRQ